MIRKFENDLMVVKFKDFLLLEVEVFFLSQCSSVRKKKIQ